MFVTINATPAKKGMLTHYGTIVEATNINAPPSTKNAEHERDGDMDQMRKGNQWHLAMKAQIGVDAHSVRVHSLTTTAANVAGIVEAAAR